MVTGYKCIKCGLVYDGLEPDEDNPGTYWIIGCWHEVSVKPTWGTYKCLHIYPQIKY